MDADSKAVTTENGTARRVTSQKDTDDKKTQSSKTTAQTQTAKTPPETKQPEPKQPEPKQEQEEEFLGDEYRTNPTKSQQATAPASTPAKPSGGSKTAKIRYLVPPVGRPMNLRIEVTDPSGRRNIVNRQVKGGETINATANYSKECLVTVYLDGQSVWQERKN